MLSSVKAFPIQYLLVILSMILPDNQCNSRTAGGREGQRPRNKLRVEVRISRFAALSLSHYTTKQCVCDEWGELLIVVYTHTQLVAVAKGGKRFGR